MATLKARQPDAAQGIQVISRAADILRLLGTETNGLSLAQIAEQVNLPRSTVQRIVAALAAEGFIAIPNRDGGITLGHEIQNLARATARDMRERFKPIMDAIQQDTGETVDLAILAGDKMRFIDQVVGSQRLRTVSSIGETFPLTSTANGKAALACLQRSESEALIRSELTADVAGKRIEKRLIKELDAIREGALATDENEHTDGVSAFGFAMMDAKGDVYALSTPVPTNRFLRIRKDLEKTLLKHRKTVFETM